MNHLPIFPVSTFNLSYFSYIPGESNKYMGRIEDALLGEGTSGPSS